MSPTKTDIEIRPFLIEDVSACIVLFNSNIPRFLNSSELAEFEDYLHHHASGSFWVGLFDQKIVACGGIHVRSDGIGRLCYGVIDASFHGMGIGSSLLLFRLDRLLENPEIRHIQLDTSQHTHGFFKKFGFSTYAIEPDYYGQGLDCYRMTLNVPMRNHATSIPMSTLKPVP